MLKIIMCNFRRKRTRFILTVLGIAIGVLSVVLISSIGEIGKKSIDKEMQDLGLGGIMVSSNRKVPGSLLGEEQLNIIRANIAVSSAVPVVVDYTKTYMRDLMMDSVIWGIDFGSNNVISLDVLYGRLITKNDVSNRKKVCVIDKSIAQAYYKRDNIVGKKISLQFFGVMEEFEVVGIVASGGDLTQGLIGGMVPSFLYVPYTTLQNAAHKDYFDYIAINPKSDIDHDVLGKQIISSLSGGNLVDNSYRFDNMGTQKEKIDAVLGMITVVLSVVAGVSMVVAGLGIMTIMITSVSERTNEIGIKKSIGASPGMIMIEFLTESTIISFLGSIVGAAGGVIVILIGCCVLSIPFSIDLSIVAYTIIFSVLLGCMFGVYPAVIASKLKPVDALRRY